MPLLLEYDEDTIKEYQDPTRKDGFSYLPLRKDLTDLVLYHKVEAVSDKRSDTQHDPNHPWHDGPFVGLPPVVLEALQRNPDFDGKILVNGEIIGEDHGIILDFHGSPIKQYRGIPTPNGYIHADTRNGTILTPQEVSANTSIAPNRIPPKYRMWEFHLHSAVWTDGPARRARLQETAEQQRAHAEENMAGSIANAFASFAKSMGQQPTNLNQMGPQSPEDLMNVLMESVKRGDMLPEQARASFDFAMDEVEATMKSAEVTNGKSKSKG